MEERHVKPRVHQGFSQFVHILRVLAKEAVFVFHLRHDDVAAVRDLQRAKHATNFFQITFCGVKIAWIAAAKFHAVLFKQPPRRAAHFPFRARIRAGAQDDPQSFFLCDAAKFGVVRLTAPIKFAGLRFVQIPKQIRAHRVQTHRFGHLQALAPIFFWHARGMNFAAANLETRAVE